MIKFFFLGVALLSSVSAFALNEVSYTYKIKSSGVYMCNGNGAVCMNNDVIPANEVVANQLYKLIDQYPEGALVNCIVKQYRGTIFSIRSCRDL